MEYGYERSGDNGHNFKKRNRRDVTIARARRKRETLNDEDTRVGRQQGEQREGSNHSC